MTEPTRIEYGPWEPDPDSEYEDRRLVATKFSLLTVLEYTEIRLTKYRRQRRERVEVWETPAVDVPRFVEDKMTFVRMHIPSTMSARKSYEYRPATSV